MRTFRPAVTLFRLSAVTAIVAQTNVLSALTVPEIVARSKPAVIQIITQTGDGTGFFISADGWAVTNHHVVEGAYVVGAKTITGKSYKSQRILFPRDSTDVALIKFAVNGVPYLMPGNVNQLAEGERILVIGNPNGLEGTVSDGIISAFRLNRTYIQITAPISPGSSGSPVLNENGKVIGIVKGTWKEESQNLNFAVSMKAIESALKDGLASSEPPSPSLSEIPSKPPPSSHESIPSDGLGPPVTEKEKRAVAFVRQLVASGNSGSNLPSPDNYYAPRAVFQGKLVTREHIARLVGIGFKIFPERSIQIVSGPFVDHSQPGPDTTVVYEIAGLMKNRLLGVQMRIATRLVIRSDQKGLAIVSNTPKILEQRLVR